MIKLKTTYKNQLIFIGCFLISTYLHLYLHNNLVDTIQHIFWNCVELCQKTKMGIIHTIKYKNLIISFTLHTNFGVVQYI